MGAFLANLILGFLAGACIRRTLWQVLVWFILPLVVAVLAVQDGAEFIVLILTFTGFIATGAGLALGSLFRALIIRISPKTQSGTNSQHTTDHSADPKG